MSKPTTIVEVIDQRLLVYIDPAKIETILSNQETILSNQETIKADLISIKAFLGVPDVKIGATEEQLDALGTRLAGETAAVEKFADTIPQQ